MKKNLYTATMIPEITGGGRDENGKELEKKVSYVHTSNPNEKARAAGYNADKFIQLQLYYQGENPLDVDLRPYTMNVFRNTNPTLFRVIEGMIENKEYDVVSDTSLAANLKNKIPGLVRTREVPKYYPYNIDKTGKSVKLMPRVRNDETGDYEPTPVIMNSVTYFMPGTMVPDTGDEEHDRKIFEANDKILFEAEKSRACRFWVKEPGVTSDSDNPVVGGGETKPEDTKKVA